jgi:diacylglycerol kinase (ATP)
MTFDPPKSILLIRNPIAGRRRRGLVDDVMRRVRAEGWTVDLVDTEASGDARRIAETCDASRYAVIAVAGGDGTINEVVNGLASRADGGPALALVPLGTANVLAHELGLRATAAIVAHTMIAGRELLVRPGEATGHGMESGLPRHFSLMAGAGFDAKVVAGVSAPLKRRLGKAAYVWRSMVETRRYRPVRYTVEVDGACYEAASVIVTRSRLYICLFERWGRLQTLRFGLALLRGRLPRTGGYRVITGRDVKVSVLSDAGETRLQPVQIDGDNALTLPISIGLAAGSVRMLQPL